MSPGSQLLKKFLTNRNIDGLLQSKVYAIYCVKTNKYFYTLGECFLQSLTIHLKLLDQGIHPNIQMQTDFNTYSGDFMVFLIEEYDTEFSAHQIIASYTEASKNTNGVFYDLYNRKPPSPFVTRLDFITNSIVGTKLIVYIHPKTDRHLNKLQPVGVFAKVSEANQFINTYYPPYFTKIVIADNEITKTYLEWLKNDTSSIIKRIRTAKKSNIN